MDSEPEIVLIDDDPDWSETLADYLSAKGFRVKIANQASAGLDFLSEHSIPLALVDWNMPDMSGLEVVRRLRQTNREMAVFMLSGADEPSLASRALAEGASAFLPKSTPANLLLQEVRQIFAAAHRMIAKNYLPAVIRPRCLLACPQSPQSAAPKHELT